MWPGGRVATSEQGRCVVTLMLSLSSDSQRLRPPGPGSRGSQSGANKHSHAATWADLWSGSPQVSATLGDVRPCSATEMSCFGNRRPRVRIPPSRLVTDQFRIYYPAAGAKMGANCTTLLPSLTSLAGTAIGRSSTGGPVLLLLTFPSFSP